MIPGIPGKAGRLGNRVAGPTECVDGGNHFGGRTWGLSDGRGSIAAARTDGRLLYTAGGNAESDQNSQMLVIDHPVDTF